MASAPGASSQFLVLDDLVIPSTSQKRPDISNVHQHRRGRRARSGGGGLPARSRSGCVTCRAKRIKCDETKPACVACTAKGGTCGGYARDLIWSTKHEKHERAAKEQASGPSHAGSAGAKSMSPEGQSRASTMPAHAASPSASMPAMSEPAYNAGDMGWETYQQFVYGASPASHHSWSNQLHAPVESSGSGHVPIDGFGSGSGIHRQPGPPSTFSTPISNTQTSPAAPTPTENTDDGRSVASSSHPLHHIQRRLMRPAVPPTLTHLPSLLVNHWFQDVCSVWSAYDSHVNLNRTIAMALWPSSETVLTSLQGMSAAFLAARVPYLKQTSIAMMRSATAAIKTELAVVKLCPQLTSVPMSLLFALFCVGTTVCWLDAAQLGVPFLREAKALLWRVNQQKRSLREEDRKLLIFFNKSWIYWDMLLTVVTYDGSHKSAEDVEEVEFPDADDSPTAEPADSHNAPEVPHPWTGVSTAASRLFTRAMKLCRRFRHKLKLRRGVTAHDLRTALAQIEQAKSIEEHLLRLEFACADDAGETWDDNTPCEHLVTAGEAYRLAALLHLYQTFPDLVALRLPGGVAADGTGQVPWDDWIVPLSLRLVELLEQLPPESGSKMMQPLLCITASTGLRLKPPATAHPPSADASLQQVSAAAVEATARRGSEENCDISEYMSRLSRAHHVVDQHATLTESCLEVGNARHFVLTRLGILETALPPKPVVMAKSLVQAIWQAYDAEPPGANSVHWLDVMERQDLRSLFG